MSRIVIVSCASASGVGGGETAEGGREGRRSRERQGFGGETNESGARAPAIVRERRARAGVRGPRADATSRGAPLEDVSKVRSFTARLTNRAQPRARNAAPPSRTISSRALAARARRFSDRPHRRQVMRSKRTFFTHPSVSTFDRVPFQPTDEQRIGPSADR
eukprot:31421-Pelagococcus_subviridis.AAC.8